MKTILWFFSKKKKQGMALAVSLIVLLVAGMMVGVSMYLVQNMMETTTMKTDNERRLNAAVAGLEFGKQQIIDTVLAGTLPKRTGGLTVSSGDIAADPVNFSALVAYSGATPFTFDEADFDAGDPSMEVDIYVYDLVYQTGSGIAFSPGLPPQMWSSLFSTGGAQAEDYLYMAPELGVNDNKGGTPFYEILGYYLVRSTSTTPDGLSATVEQSVVIQR